MNSFLEKWKLENLFLEKACNISPPVNMMQENSTKLIRPMSLISHLLKGVGSLSQFIYFPKFSGV